METATLSANPAMSPRVAPYFKDYASFHKTPGNQATHMMGIPMIVVAVLGMLGHLVIGDGLTGSELFRVDGGAILWLLASLWYFKLEWKLALPFALINVGFYFLGRAIPMPWLAAMFVVGWIIQYVGHYVYEHKSPAFYKSLEHLLIGPFWIFAKLVGYWKSA
jgi:uncharacterized membrane protein YGL010W